MFYTVWIQNLSNKVLFFFCFLFSAKPDFVREEKGTYKSLGQRFFYFFFSPAYFLKSLVDIK